MEELIDRNHIEGLMDTLREAGRLDYCEDLFNGLSTSYKELIEDEDYILDSRNSESVGAQIHKLRNRYRNLGMKQCDLCAKDLELLVKQKTRVSENERILLDRLKTLTFSSLNLFFQEFLP